MDAAIGLYPTHPTSVDPVPGVLPVLAWELRPFPTMKDHAPSLMGTTLKLQEVRILHDEPDHSNGWLHRCR